MAPYDRPYTTFYWSAIVYIALSGTVYELLQRLQKIDIGEIPVMSSTVRTLDTARDLGVVIDSGLSMADQVSAICRAAYYQLR